MRVLKTKTGDTLPAPGGICNQCITDPRHTFQNEAGEVASFCEHNETGGILIYVEGIDRPCWQLFTPISRATFIKLFLREADGMTTTLQ